MPSGTNQRGPMVLLLEQLSVRNESVARMQQMHLSIPKTLRSLYNFGDGATLILHIPTGCCPKSRPTAHVAGLASGALALGMLVVLLVLLSRRRRRRHAIHDIGLAVNPLGQEPSPSDDALGRLGWDVQQFRGDDLPDRYASAKEGVTWNNQQCRLDESQLDIVNFTSSSTTVTVPALDRARHT